MAAKKNRGDGTKSRQQELPLQGTHMTGDPSSHPHGGANNDQDNPYAGLSALAEWRRRWRDPITLFTALLVIVGALQFCSLEKTDDTLKSTVYARQRPWISVTDIRNIQPFEGVGAYFLLEFDLKNYGRTPTIVALKTRIIIAEAEGDAWKEYPAKLCTDADREIEKFKWMIFPDATLSYRDEVHAVEIDRMKIGSNDFVPTIVGCVAYGSDIGKPRRHQSPFIANISREKCPSTRKRGDYDGAKFNVLLKDAPADSICVRDISMLGDAR
jgi:hypothetical protein